MLVAAMIDNREPPHIQAIKIGSVTPMVQMLPTGDAWLACDDVNLVIERKTVSDLLASIADGRLLEQCPRMTQASPWCYVVVTGMLACQNGYVVNGGQVTQWQYRSVMGALLTVQELGVEIVFCDGDADYANTLGWLADRKRDTIKVKPQRRDVTLQSPAETLLCALPGISEKRAADLLHYCGTAAWAINYLTQDDNPNSVPGVGAGTRAAARSVFGLADNEFLSVLVIDDEAYSEKENISNE